ncbi:DUF6455 family protein [Defluviimonas sp. D31]|uniref:DUF6455 family protein n=1 Tax=Defluviimonas sp. D31 TaxID=3083253 RepID=UPI00296F589B|nr:DUF6455 family protein [Defluviimonas sp. D31]
MVIARWWRKRDGSEEGAMGSVVRMAAKSGGAGAELPYFLTEEETRRHGVDIGEAIQSGILTPDDFRAILALCRDCNEGRELRREPGHDRHAHVAPDWCANRAVLEGLRGIV